VFVSRSPERFGFVLEEPGAPVVVSVTGAGGVSGSRGAQVIPDHALLTTLANSGYLAAAGDTVYFAPLSRPELVALGPGGDTLWTSLAVGLPPAPEPRFRLLDGRANIEYQPMNLALTLGPDGHLYVLRATDTAVRHTRLDVIDRATGHVLRSAHLDRIGATLAANRLGRVYLLDGDRLLGAIPPARRESFPGFDLPRLSGGRVSSDETAGRVALINVWASWCTPCRTEMPALDSLQRGLPAEGFTFLALNEDTDRGAAERFIRELGFDFPVLFGDGKLKARFHYPGLPYTVLLDRQGRIVRRWFGELAPADYPMIRMLVRSELLAPGSDSGSAAVEVHHHHDTP
jgi:thiol-disulfide isomerase/thioredoxin